MNATPLPAPKTDHVDVRGASLFTRAVGTGPDVIVLHGGPGAPHTSLLPQFDRLARGRSLRFYDQRGCGRSQADPHAPLGWQQHVADLEHLIATWDLAPATVLGYSWGGLLSMLFALAYPDRVRRLALVCPAPVRAVERRAFERRFAERLRRPSLVERQRALQRADLRHRDPERYRRHAFAISIAPYFKDPTGADHVPPFVVAQRVRESVWRSLGDYDLSDDLRRLSVPTLIVHGRHDPIPLSAARHTASLLDARLEIFEHSGHVPFIEEPDRFTEVLDGFLPKVEQDE